MYAEPLEPPRSRAQNRVDRRSWVLPTLVSLLIVSPAAAQWTRQSPVPTFLDVRGVGAPTAQHAFLATSDDSFDEGGALFETTDGGATWVQRDVPLSLADPLDGMFFLDSQRGWTFGNDNYRTTDGGATWTQLPFLGSTYGMEFSTASFGVARSNGGRYVSRDGGLSWQPSPNDIASFDFVNDSNGLGAASTGVYRTSDGGTNFTVVSVGDADDVTFLTELVAVAIVDGAFRRSTDGGFTWTTGASAASRSRLLKVNDNAVLAWGRSGSYPDFDDRILRSADGGQTWTDLGEVMDPGSFSSGFAFAVPDPQTVVASDGAGNLFRSADAGQTWSMAFESPGPRPSFFSSARPAFADAQNGYFGFGVGFVVKTTDGGASWTQISSGTGQSLNDMDRFPNGDLVAVGDNGTVLIGNGAVPWIQRSIPTTSDLVAVDVVGPTDLVIAEQSGRILRSTDGGTTWGMGATAPANLTATDLSFTTVQDGWVIGSGFGGGALFHTTNGGDSWTPVTDFQGGYAAVDFEGQSGWAANVGDVFWRTTDGGASWEAGQLPGFPYQVMDMDFFDGSLGYAIGSFGYAARSDDGGLTWEVLPTPNAADTFTDLHLLGPNELWLSTNNDTAYYTATGGQSWSVMPIGSGGFGNFSTIVGTPAGDAWAAGGQGYLEFFAGPPPQPLNRPPEASFDFVANGMSVSFTDASTDPDGFIASWFWEFGDSTTSTEQNPSHTYSEANTYIVRLTVTDDDGDTGSTGRLVVAQPGPGGTFGDFTEVTPLDPLFVTPQDEDFWVIATAPADYDLDGDLDVAVLGYYVVYNASVEDRLVLVRNEGPAGPGEWNFSYVDVPLGTMSTGASDLAWGDADGDGDDDLVVGSNGQTALFRNDAGTLTATDTMLPGYWEENDQADFDLRSITWADFDNDGDQDLLLPSVFDPDSLAFRTALMRNDGENGTGGWNFSEVDSVFAPTHHAQSAWADYDDDGDLDLLLVHLAPLTDEGFIRRYRNDGNGAFVGEDILGTLTVEHGEAQWGDYDADGDLDVLVAGHVKETDETFAQALRIYRNDAETYVPIEIIACPSCEGWWDFTAGTWADYDSDGDADILLAGTYNSGSNIEGRARVYANGGGMFTPTDSELPAPRASGDRGGTFSWLDLDGDGDLDYFIAGQYFVPGGNGLVEAQMHVYRNDVQGQNQVPSAPTEAMAVVGSAGTVQFAWTPATDDLTPSAALTYDLELYRDGVPAASARRLPEPGSISTAADWSLTGLPEGTYAWTLRAVDSAYNGGPVAQGTFTIGAPTGAGEIVLPRELALAPSSPNPFRRSTTFRFALPKSGDVTLSIYDLAGRLVTRLVEGRRGPGYHEVAWNARDVASGVYFARLSTGKEARSQRVLVLK